ncbi:MAG TPA: GAF domain-containing protein, partial [Anaerolineales bacterium]|nr:GAF domain-containing protein [Anaerolineales bacterium]
MPKPPLPANEQERLAALARYSILDTPPEPAFDDVTRLVGRICQTPIALVVLIDSDRQWFKSRVGFKPTELPRDSAFCSHTILQNDVLVVPDALADSRFADNRLVVAAPHVRFYAGATLLTADGLALGTLCVYDLAPRELTPHQVDALRVLSRQVMAQLELRLKAKSLQEANAVREQLEEEKHKAEEQLQQNFSL